jgi:hypothetical protein
VTPQRIDIGPRALVAVVCFCISAGGVHAQGENPFQYCQRVITDDNPGPPPPALIRSFASAFHMPAASVAERIGSGAFHYRCYQGTVMGCWVGANLNCGRAETQTRNDGADEWCRAHPNDPNIPAVATGHSTIYVWRYVGSRAGTRPEDLAG